ncbi:MAG: recombination protein RecR [Proteobacteria bacterium]|nr:MAG: recombination protein RecR [Pseudomonadota bacterium]
MSFLPTTADALSTLVHELAKLPGIGEKSATRLAFHLLNADSDRVKRLTDSLLRAKEKIRLCSNCFTYTEEELCEICVNPMRSQDAICVVERPSDVRALESSGKFKGTYHVLHGTLSPVDGIGPDQIRVQELLRRVNKWESMEHKELVLALNPSVEGEATGLYVARLTKPLGLKVYKIAYGLPMGGSIEYADRGTLGRALENRVEF